MGLLINKRLLWTLLLLVNSTLLFAKDYYVAPDGSDSARGTLKHPFASIQQAIEAARGEGQVNIFLRGGTYYIDQTIVFDDQDTKVSVQPYKNEAVVFTGGISIPVRKLKGKERLGEGKVKYTVDLKKLGINNYGQIRNVGFARPYGVAWGEVFVNKKPMHLSRWPNKGMIPMGKVLEKGSIPRYDDFSNKGGVIEYDSARIDDWSKEKNTWMSGYFMWGYADDMVKIASIDTEKKTITTETATLYGYGSDKPWRNWYGVNILAELDDNGEYYIDRESGLLSFISDEEDIYSLEFSVLEDPFFLLSGAKNITIKGITFECSRGLGIAMSNTENVIVDDCVFRNLGSLAITVGKGIEAFEDYRHEGTGQLKEGVVGSYQQHYYANTTCNREGGSNNKIINCEFYQLGAGGVSLGGGDRLTLEAGNNVVENCIFHDLNRIEKSYRPAVHLTGVGNKVIHCEIYNTPSMAIYMYGNNHVMEYNYLHDVCLEAEDQGAFYYGRDPSERGTVIRFNYFENIPDHFNTCAIYHDDGACGLTVESNIFYKAGKWNVLMGGGSDNIYRNNIFIGNKIGLHIDNRLQNWSKALLDDGGLYEKRLQKVSFKKPPYSVQYPEMVTYFENPSLPKRNVVENNVFVQVGQLIDGNKEWLDYRANNWLTEEDPGFVDFTNNEFKLNKTSNVYNKLPEFKAIPFEKIGLYGSMKE